MIARSNIFFAVLSPTRKYCFTGHGCQGECLVANVTSEMECCDGGGVTWGSSHQGICEPCGQGKMI